MLLHHPHHPQPSATSLLFLQHCTLGAVVCLPSTVTVAMAVVAIANEGFQQPQLAAGGLSELRQGQALLWHGGAVGCGLITIMWCWGWAGPWLEAVLVVVLCTGWGAAGLWGALPPVPAGSPRCGGEVQSADSLKGCFLFF